MAWTVTWTARKHAVALGPDVSKTYLTCGSWTIFLWFLYPIAWGLSEGGNVIAPDSEAVFYGILDIMAKPVFGALLLWGHRNIDPSILGREFISPSPNPFFFLFFSFLRLYEDCLVDTMPFSTHPRLRRHSSCYARRKIP